MELLSNTKKYEEAMNRAREHQTNVLGPSSLEDMALGFGGFMVETVALMAYVPLDQYVTEILRPGERYKEGRTAGASPFRAVVQTAGSCAVSVAVTGGIKAAYVGLQAVDVAEKIVESVRYREF